MNKDLYMPVARAVTALFLVLLVKFAAVLTLKKSMEFYLLVDIALSFAVIFILLKFMVELNRMVAGEDARSSVTGLVAALVIITLYLTFRPYSDFLPGGVYDIIFFLLLLIPLYSLWTIIDKNTDKLSELFVLKEKGIRCSCGWENSAENRYCGKCGSSLPEKIKP